MYYGIWLGNFFSFASWEPLKNEQDQGPLSSVTDADPYQTVTDPEQPSELINEVLTYLKPHHLVVLATVGQDHLGAVLAQSVANAAAQESAGPKHGDHVTAEWGAAAPTPLHSRQIYLSRLQLKVKHRFFLVIETWTDTD